MSTRQPISRSKPQSVALLALGIALGTPSVVLANAGTPLIWVTILHLYVGNAFIGILEGALLARVYRVSASRAVWLMILANYFSAWLGWLWLSELLQDRDDLNLYNTRPYLWGMVLVAYIATLILEWPFLAGCFRGQGNWLRKSFIASLLVQTVSYVLLFGWFYSASVNSLFTDTTIVSVGEIALPSDVRIYYIADADGDVYSMTLNSGNSEKVFDLNSRDDADSLSIEDSQTRDGFQEIVGLIESGAINQTNVIRTGIVVPTNDCPRDDKHALPRIEQSSRLSPSQECAAKLGSALDSPWTIQEGRWAAQGLSGENSITGADFRLALETWFIQWPVRHSIVLPTNKVLFQLGKKQICIFDLDTRKLAVACYGYGAVAVLQRPTSQQ